jgi:hypothetical protein
MQPGYLSEGELKGKIIDILPYFFRSAGLLQPFFPQIVFTHSMSIN